MDQTREQLEKPPTTSTGIAADMKRLKSDTASTAEEVREFIANLKGRSPQEVLGAVSESGLVQATVQATFGCLVVLVACTVLPWAWKSDEPEVAAETKPVATEAAPETSENTTTDSQSGAAVAEARSGDDSPSSSDAARAAAAMKIDETVVTDPKKNPLDGNLDKLLDGLD
tara:strand:+ start:205327 stop:205839 length:513 start_codon:yes stop_codon:yes gene_type:complete